MSDSYQPTREELWDEAMRMVAAERDEMQSHLSHLSSTRRALTTAHVAKLSSAALQLRRINGLLKELRYERRTDR